MGLLYQLVKWPILTVIALVSILWWLVDTVIDAFRRYPGSNNSCIEADTHALMRLQNPVLGSHNIVNLNHEFNTHYVASGPEDKPLMLLVHGFPEFWYTWRYQIKEFQKDYRVVAMDQRAYGESLGIMETMSSFDLTKLASDIQTLVDYMGYKKCVLVGHDWGGIVCFRVAQAHPGVVDKLIILNSFSVHAYQRFLTSPDGYIQLMKSWYIFLFFQLPWIPERLFQFWNFLALDFLFLRDPVYKKGRMTQTDLDAYKYTFRRSGVAGPITYYRRFIRRPPARVDYTKVTAPTLIIWGDQDPYLETEIAHLSSKLSVEGGATVSLVKGGGHFIQMEEPDVVNQLMRKFLS